MWCHEHFQLEHGPGKIEKYPIAFGLHYFLRTIYAKIIQEIMFYHQKCLQSTNGLPRNAAAVSEVFYVMSIY